MGAIPKELGRNYGLCKNKIILKSLSKANIHISSRTISCPTYTTTQSPAATTGDSTATIVSQGMRGYQVFLDGNYIGTEGTGGDPLDGRFSFSVVGNQNHDIRVYDGQFNYPKTMFFERGGTKIINVEPGTAVYIWIANIFLHFGKRKGWSLRGDLGVFLLVGSNE